MDGYQWKNYVKPYDARREAVIPGDSEATINFSIEHFISLANDAIDNHGYFTVALSGGSTPKKIFEGLCSEKYRHKIQWDKVYLFWSDERAVLETDPSSNYKMAMDAGFAQLPIPHEQVFRMKGEDNIEAHAHDYEKILLSHPCNGVFDLVMLGMGEDGHTASLFPETHALHSAERLVVANFIPKLETWRMTLTFPCINQARNIAIYVLGASKAQTLEQVLSDNYQPDLFPIQKIGTPSHPATWIIDNEAMASIYPHE